MVLSNDNYIVLSHIKYCWNCHKISVMTVKLVLVVQVERLLIRNKRPNWDVPSVSSSSALSKARLAYSSLSHVRRKPFGSSLAWRFHHQIWERHWREFTFSLNIFCKTLQQSRALAQCIPSPPLTSSQQELILLNPKVSFLFRGRKEWQRLPLIENWAALAGSPHIAWSVRSSVTLNRWALDAALAFLHVSNKKN